MLVQWSYSLTALWCFHACSWNFKRTYKCIHIYVPINMHECTRISNLCNKFCTAISTSWIELYNGSINSLLASYPYQLKNVSSTTSLYSIKYPGQQYLIDLIIFISMYVLNVYMILIIIIIIIYISLALTEFHFFEPLLYIHRDGESCKTDFSLVLPLIQIRAKVMINSVLNHTINYKRLHCHGFGNSFNSHFNSALDHHF